MKTQAKMPWLALPFNDPRKNDLASRYSTAGIPCLTIVAADGKIVTQNARGDVSGHSVGACLESWSKGEGLTQGG